MSKRTAQRGESTGVNTASVPAAAKPWEHAKHGEGSAGDPLAARFVESLSYDTRLYDADIRGSIAHARMLREAGLMTGDDLNAIERGLGEIRREIETAPAGTGAVGVAGAWPGWKPELEDVHMCIEAELVAKVGDAGRKLHTGRSRNDQVAVDLRLWLRGACAEMERGLGELTDAFAGLARREGDVVIPTYTHLQRAQPACVGAECMAWWAMFERDRALLRAMPRDAAGLGSSPLGSGAVAGSTLPLDRAHTARSLGFAGPSLSSIDATASRDEALDFVYALSRTGLHLSRFAEHWIIYCTTEFGFLTLGEAYTTGSSMMPQKRNPDMLELIRGKCGTVLGHFTALATILKGLPLAYNRDLQEDKRHVFAAFDTAMDCVRMASRIVASAAFNADRIGETLSRGHLDATVLAEYFVERGVPFRTAHQIVGSLVRVCDRNGRSSLSELDIAEFNSALDSAGFSGARVDRGVLEHLGAANVVRRYRSGGHAGTGPGGYKDWLSGLGASGEAPGSGATDDEPAAPAKPKEHGAQPASLFGEGGPNGKPSLAAADASLIKAYESAGRTLDDLPYTPEFDRLFATAERGRPGVSRREVLHRLQNLRKAGRLPKVGKAAGLAIKLQPKEEAWLRSEVQRAAGSLGQRDQLPYDAKFDALVEGLNSRTGRSLTPHDVWRLVAKLAK